MSDNWETNRFDHYQIFSAFSVYIYVCSSPYNEPPVFLSEHKMNFGRPKMTKVLCEFQLFFLNTVILLIVDIFSTVDDCLNTIF